MLGLYVAEGCSEDGGLVRISLHKKETDLARRFIEIVETLGYHVCLQKQPEGKNAQVLVFRSHPISRFLRETCGHRAEHKQIPDFILYNTDIRLLRAFLDGYIQGDGSSYVKRNGYRAQQFATTSKVLAQQLQLAYARLGVFVSLSSRPPRDARFGDRVYRCKTAYAGLFYPEGKDGRTGTYKENPDYFFVPISGIGSFYYSGEVWNMTTEDNSYLVSNAVVHNCNQCTSNDFDTLTQGLSEEMVELATDANPGSGWVIGNLEICDYCDENFKCEKKTTGEYCLPPSQLLLGDNKQISQYKLGDSVVGRSGLEGVVQTFERYFSGNLVEVKGTGLLPFKLTPNHPVLVVRGTAERKGPIEYSPPMWKNADLLREKHSFLQGDYLVLPRII